MVELIIAVFQRDLTETMQPYPLNSTAVIAFFDALRKRFNQPFDSVAEPPSKSLTNCLIFALQFLFALIIFSTISTVFSLNCVFRFFIDASSPITAEIIT